ncbi:DUF6597 domain-containing transcriptional factor [Bacillus pretiosus]|uniref:DUF6597 domain-containing transcriptional factor n=1 Tax=Bacillus pretiosus TaxID=2983392 RepID=UPI003D6493C7
MRLFRPLQPPILQYDPLDSTYRYQEYLPSKILESYIACYWTVEFHASDKNKLHRIVPDGCVDIIFDLKASSFLKGAIVTELMTEYEVIDLSQDCSLFGIRFYIDCAAHFFRSPISSVRGNTVFLEDIWGNEALFITEDIQSSTRISEKIQKVESKLLTFLPLNELKTDSLIKTGIQNIFAHQGILTIHSLSEKLCYSERHIRRTFKNELGVSPKELLHIIRFQSLLKELYIVPQTQFIDITLKYGYYDQSHFIKDFKRFYGVSPSNIFNPSRK